jgi:hypothetical protein
MSNEAVAAGREPETKQEQLARLKKARAKKENSLIIQIMESDLYDYNPGARFLLVILAHGTRVNEDAHIPKDMPQYMKDDKCLGWCDQAQWRLAIRCGKSESQIQRDIKRFRKDGVVLARGWTDSNKAEHLMYKIVEDVVKEHKRPEQKKDVERPSRYKTKNPNRGRFGKKNQPVHAKKARAATSGVNEDDA